MKRSKNLILIHITTVLLTSILLSCGSEKEEESDKTVYATMNVESSSATTAFELTNKDLCSFNKDSDVFDATFSKSGSMLYELKVQITGIAGDSGTKTCAQTNPNSMTDDADTENCAVSFKSPGSSDSASYFDGYSMYDNIDSPDAFTYDGVCTIEWSRNSASFSGTINCTNMILSHRNSMPVNPVSLDSTSSLINTTFSCGL